MTGEPQPPEPDAVDPTPTDPTDPTGTATTAPTDPAATPSPTPTGPTRPARLAAALRRRYGASPLHLALHVAGIALIAWALREVFGHYSATAVNLAVWLVAGAVLNDFVALPLYVGVDRAARRLWAPARKRIAARGGASAEVPGRGHVRVPAVMSATMLLVFLPNVLGKAPRGHELATGLAHPPDYAGRWLLITAGLFLASAVVYAARVLRASAAASAARRPSPR